MKKWIAAFVCLLVSVSVISAAVIVANAEPVNETLGNLTITGDGIQKGTDYSYDENTKVITILSKEKMTITGTSISPSQDNSTPVDRIVVKSPSGANLTLSNLTIDSSTMQSDTINAAALEIDTIITSKDAIINITLEGDNVLKSPSEHAGLQKSSEACTLIIGGKGTLTAVGGMDGAGIGGANGNGSNIQIYGGTIIAKGGTLGAGIGGGNGGNGSNIQIHGGTIIAESSSDGGAGIGGGNGGNGEKIYIYDCESITANGNGGGAGIGGGKDGDGNDIQIQKGEYREYIKANGSGSAAGIGGGLNGNGTNITISGGEIEAYGGDSAAGIGGGLKGNGTNIIISGGSITTNGGNMGAGIGGGTYGSGSGITISNGTVTANGGNGSAGIGGGAFGGSGGKTINIKDDDGNIIEISGITISGGTVTANGGNGGAGIGGGGNIGTNGVGTNITISGGSVEATGGGSGAGIGGGMGGAGSGITISGGTKITAKGGSDGAGIGGGSGGSGSGITISGGSVEATGVDGGAGIGGGSNGSGGAAIEITDGGETKSFSGITIKGSSKVTATGGYRGAGIGGGYQGDGSNITIGDDSDSAADIANRVVIATSKGAFEGQNGNGAGIGGGGAGNGEDITINSGKVIATSDLGAGIGGGGVTEAEASNRGGDGKKITINGGNIEATSNGGGAGIGGGQQGGKGIDITINDGTVTATSKGDTDKGGNGIGAGIGGGSCNTTYNFKGNGENIIINGGIVTATGTGAGIGGGGGGDGIGITISGSAVVTATGATKDGFGGSAGIGGGNGGDGTDITISGNAKVTAASLQNGADIGGGSSGVGTNITISENADVTVDNRGCQVCIGGWSNEDSVIKITGGTVKTTTNTKTPMLGLGSLGQVDITISGDANVDVAGSIAIGSMRGLGSVKIDGAKEVTATGNNAGINCNNITINGNNDTKVTATCNANFGVGIGSATDSENCTVKITGGTVRATNTDGGTGIGGTGSTVDIQGTSSTSYPWVFTNKITSKNGNDDYFGIVFDENHKNTYTEADKPVAGEEACNSDPEVYGADGVVYGNDNGREDGLVVLNKEYALESGKVLRVQDGAAFKIPEVGVLTLEAGSILYIEKGADLDKYDKITYEGEGNNKGKVLHEAKSKYEDVTDEDGKTKKLCTLCGSETNHTWKTDWVYSKIHHWHECEKNTDCSIHEYKIDLCSIIENEDKYGYGEHSFVKTRSNNTVTFECSVCGYSYNVKIPEISIYKVGSDDEGEHSLPGAKFRLYSNADCTELVGEEVTAVDKTVDGETKAAAVFTADIDLDTLYYIKETEAPDGYIKSNKVYTVKVTAETDESDESDIPIELPYEPQTIDGKAAYGVLNSEGNVTELNSIPTYVNTKRITPDPIKIIKVDGGKTSLAGAEFSVYSDAACKEPIAGMTGTTAIDTDKTSDTYNKAVVSFSTGLDTTYYIKEITPPEGYTASEEVYRAVVGKNGKVAYSVAAPGGDFTALPGIPTCINTITPDPVEIVPDPAKIIKVDGETKAPLAGAQFGIYSDAERTKLIKTVTAEIDTDNASATYNKAVVSFATELNKTYYIKETFAPDGYKVSDEVYRAVVGADGKVTYSVVGSASTLEGIPVCENYAVEVTPDPIEIVPAPAKLIKVDSETGAPLAGAQFDIYSDAECTKLITTGITVLDTDNASATYNQAVVSFDTEPNRTYFIKETSAPDGYRVSHEVFKAVVDADGKVTYAAAGSAATSETVPVCKNEKTDEDDDISDLEPDPEDTPPAKAVSPKTGDTSESGIVGMAILSGITCAASLVGGVQKRKFPFNS